MGEYACTLAGFEYWASAAIQPPKAGEDGPSFDTNVCKLQKTQPLDRACMAIATIAALRSEDPRRKVGCVLTDGQATVVGLGYNAFPDKVTPWDQPTAKVAPEGTPSSDSRLAVKDWFIVHAEHNALNHVHPFHRGRHRLTAYTTRFPCERCLPMLLHGNVAALVTQPTSAFDPAMLESTAAKALAIHLVYKLSEKPPGAPVHSLAQDLEASDGQS